MEIIISYLKDNAVYEENAELLFLVLNLVSYVGANVL
jgi:hypothetical protein